MASQVCMTVPTPPVPRSFSARGRLSGFRGEVPYRPHELLGGLKLREVAGFWQQLEPGAGDGSGIGAAVAGIDDPVGVAPDNQGGCGDRGETAEQGRVGHPCPAIYLQRGPVGGHAGPLRLGRGGRVDTERGGVVVGQPGQFVQAQREDVGDRVR